MLRLPVNWSVQKTKQKQTKDRKQMQKQNKQTNIASTSKLVVQYFRGR
jgi:hypothetical protein